MKERDFSIVRAPPMLAGGARGDSFDFPLPSSLLPHSSLVLLRPRPPPPPSSSSPPSSEGQAGRQAGREEREERVRSEERA
jgi:hypothetical protein